MADLKPNNLQLLAWLTAENQYDSGTQAPPDFHPDTLHAALNNIAEIDNLGPELERQKAKDLLFQLNAYIARHGLSAFKPTPDQRARIEQQIVALKTTPQTPIASGLNFALKGSVYIFFLPFIMIGSGLYGFLDSINKGWLSKTLRNSGLPEFLKPGDYRYGTRLEDNLSDDPDFKASPLSLLLLPFSWAINAVTAMVFIPLRYLFGYDSWTPTNQARLDGLEKAIFNVLIAPLQGVLSAVYHTFANFFKPISDIQAMFNDDGSMKKGIQAQSRYGLGVFRFAWFREKSFIRNNLGAVLNFLLLPVDLLVGATFNALRCALAFPNWSKGAQDAFQTFETGVYALAGAAWLGLWAAIGGSFIAASVGAIVAAIVNVIAPGTISGGAAATFSAVAGWAVSAFSTAQGAIAVLFTGLGNGIAAAATTVGSWVAAAGTAVAGFFAKFTLALFAQNVFAPAAAAGSTTSNLAIMARAMVFIGGFFAITKGVQVGMDKRTPTELLTEKQERFKEAQSGGALLPTPVSPAHSNTQQPGGPGQQQSVDQTNTQGSASSQQHNNSSDSSTEKPFTPAKGNGSKTQSDKPSDDVPRRGPPPESRKLDQ